MRRKQKTVFMCERWWIGTFHYLKIIYLTSPLPLFLPTSLLSQKSSLLLPGGFEWASKLSFPSKAQEMFLLISEIIWSPHQYQCWATYVCYRGNLGYFLSSTHRLIDNSYSACNIVKEITVFCAAKRESLTNMFKFQILKSPSPSPIFISGFASQAGSNNIMCLLDPNLSWT